jgi:hypothetical protein
MTTPTTTQKRNGFRDQCCVEGCELLVSNPDVDYCSVQHARLARGEDPTGVNPNV